MSIQPGLSAVIEIQVTDADTATALGSGDVPVLGTPRVVAVCEEAAVAAVEGRLLGGTTTVGFKVQIEHISPTSVGHTVRVEATLDKVDGRRLVFAVSVKDERGLVAAGKVTRVLVDRERFLAKAD